MSTVFPHRRISGIIFSAPFIQRSQYITLRLLFEGGNYMRKYSMYMLYIGIRIPLNSKKAYLNGFPLTKTPGPSDWPCSGLYDTTLPWMDKLRDRGASSSFDIEACRNIGIMGNRASPAFWALCSCSLSWPSLSSSGPGLIHGLLYIWTELLSFFLADILTWGGNLRPKLHPRVDFLDHEFYNLKKSHHIIQEK